MSATRELKARTRDLHERIEKVVPLLDPALTVGRYTAYLQQLFPFYQQVEEHLRLVPNLRAAVRDLDERWKTGLLTMDLDGCGRRFELKVEPSFVPRPRTVPEALGCLYVLEGSTLGAQILIQAVNAGLGGAVHGKTHFLQSYGSAVSEKWRDLCAALNSALEEANDLETAVEAARITFECLHNWLVFSRRQTEMTGEPVPQ